MHKTYNYIKGAPVGIGFMMQIIKFEMLEFRSWKLLIYTGLDKTKFGTSSLPLMFQKRD